MTDNEFEYQETSEDFADESEAQYQEVTVVSWSQRLLGSLIAVLLGVLFFLSSFVVLFINEGNTDFSKVAHRAVVLAPEVVTPGAQGKIVSLTGNITTSPAIGDNLYLQPGAYVALARTVEMYSWDEKEETTTQKNLGGSETRVTTYTYTKQWTDEPKASNSFKKSNYRNPPKAVENQLFKAEKGNIGRYSLDMGSLTSVVDYPYSCTSDGRRHNKSNGTGIRLQGNRVMLTPQTILVTRAQPVGDYLFQGRGTPQLPKIGDVRICYTALPTNSIVTIFGKLQGDRILPASYNNEPFFRLSSSNRDGAIAEFKSEYQIWLWIFRVLGFVLMWVGLWLLVNPISVVLSVIPFLSDLADIVNGTASFIVAFVLSAVTILVSSLIHQPVVLVGSVVVTLVVLVLGQIVLRTNRA